MFWIVVAFALIVLIAALVARRLQTRRAVTSVAYQRRRVLFTPAERSFLAVLELAVGNDFRVLGKVRLGDLLAPQTGLQRHAQRAALNRIDRRHLDFVLCDPDNLAVLCVIELSGKSHQRRQDRDGFLVDACQRAGLPLIMLDARQAYSPAELSARIAEAVSPRAEKRAEPVVQASVPGNSSFVFPDSELGPLCPRCSSLMVKRQGSGRKNTGRDFWGCSNFPDCPGVLTT
jgi:hypothetical protein